MRPKPQAAPSAPHSKYGARPSIPTPEPILGAQAASPATSQPVSGMTQQSLRKTGNCSLLLQLDKQKNVVYGYLVFTL